MKTIHIPQIYKRNTKRKENENFFWSLSSTSLTFHFHDCSLAVGMWKVGGVQAYRAMDELRCFFQCSETVSWGRVGRRHKGEIGTKDEDRYYTFLQSNDISVK